MFKILSLEFFDHSFFGSLFVSFVPEREANNNNYISFIIGPNGTGKSKILLSLINIINSLDGASKVPSKKYNFEYAYRLIFENSGERFDIFYDRNTLLINEHVFHFAIEFLDLPKKMLISCFSFNDKYPLREQRGKIINENYHYLGLKSTTNNIFISNPTKAAIANLNNAIIFNKDIAPLKEAFTILDLKPELTLIYKQGKYFNFLQLLAKNNRVLDAGDFRDLFESVVEEKRRRSANPELKRLGNEKIGNFFEQRENVEELQEYLSTFLSEILTIRKKEISLKPVLNFETVSTFQEFARHVLPLQILSDLEIISFQRFDIKKKGSHFSFDEASSGEYHIVLTFLNILSLLEDNSLVMLDEPEISLHPNWQIRYMDIFNRIFSRFPASHFIIASHSHFLVSDLKDHHSTVLAITASEAGKIMATTLDQNTFGWSAEQILLDVFDVATTRNYYLTRIVGKILDELSRENSNLGQVKEEIIQLRNIDIDNLNDNDPIKMVIRKLLSKVEAV